jgi:hypothetical protein
MEERKKKDEDKNKNAIVKRKNPNQNKRKRGDIYNIIGQAIKGNQALGKAFNSYKFLSKNYAKRDDIKAIKKYSHLFSDKDLVYQID